MLSNLFYNVTFHLPLQNKSGIIQIKHIKSLSIEKSCDNLSIEDTINLPQIYS